MRAAGDDLPKLGRNHNYLPRNRQPPSVQSWSIKCYQKPPYLAGSILASNFHNVPS